MNQKVSIVKLIEQVVATMRNDPALTSIMLTNEHVTLEQIPFYMPGHPVEIENRLKEKNKDRVNMWLKYPLITLITDIPEVHRGDMVDFTMTLGIVTFTDRKYNTEQRLDNVFLPVLYPLYDLFFLKLRESGLFVWSGNQEKPEHTAIDRYYFGSEAAKNNEALIFSDPLDAIEIADLKLSCYLNQCNYVT